VPREANPLLLAWPLNNYWNTNFPLSQPGRLRLRYGLGTHGAFDAAEAGRRAAAFAQPLLVHPAFGGGAASGELP
jgi:alpha-mannosidase